MPITEAQRIERRKHIGSSDMAAVLGVDPWRTPFDVWAEKTGRLLDEKPTAAMERGNRYESGVLDFAEAELGALVRNVHCVRPGTALASNVDGVLVDTGEPVEAKTSTMMDQWGPAGTDQVPEQYIVQCHVHMLCREVPGPDAAVKLLGEVEGCHLAVFLGGREERLYRIPLNNDLSRIIVDEAAKFWTCVERDTPPAGAVGTPHVLKLMRREPEKIVSIDPAIVRTWLDAKAALKAAGEHEEQAKAAVLTAMGNGEAALCGDLGALTYLTVNRKGYTVQPSSYRQLRHKPQGL